MLRTWLAKKLLGCVCVALCRLSDTGSFDQDGVASLIYLYPAGISSANDDFGVNELIFCGGWL